MKQHTRHKAAAAPEFVVKYDGQDLFVIADGVRIAKRGHPGTAQAGTWVPLEPGWEVKSYDNHARIEIEHFGVKLH